MQNDTRVLTTKGKPKPTWFAYASHWWAHFDGYTLKALQQKQSQLFNQDKATTAEYRVVRHLIRKWDLASGPSKQEDVTPPTTKCFACKKPILPTQAVSPKSKYIHAWCADAPAPVVKAKPKLNSFERLLQRTLCKDSRGHYINVMMVGPAGCGKSTIAELVAKKLKLDFYADSFNRDTPPWQLTGKTMPGGGGNHEFVKPTIKKSATLVDIATAIIDGLEQMVKVSTQSGQWAYVPAAFVNAYEQGGIWLGDEIDAADANTLLVLNAALANGWMSVSERTENPMVKRHKDFHAIAAANTYGSGSRMYCGREELDEATLSRFVPLSIDYDLGYEAGLLAQSNMKDEITKFRDGVRKAINIGKLRRVYSTRHIDQWIGLCNGGVELEDTISEYFMAWSQTDRDIAYNHGVMGARAA